MPIWGEGKGLRFNFYFLRTSSLTLKTSHRDGSNGDGVGNGQREGRGEKNVCGSPTTLCPVPPPIIKLQIISYKHNKYRICVFSALKDPRTEQEI